MVTLLYNLILVILLPFYLIYMCFKGIKWPHRLGMGLSDIKRKGKGGLWFHAVSLGETKALTSIIPLFQEVYTAPLLISSTTKTGYEEAIKLFPNAFHFYLPYDLFTGRLVRAIKPKFLIFSETDLWLNLAREAKKVGAVTGVVSAKMSERSMRRYRWFKPYSKALFKQFSAIGVQNETYKKRFIASGCPEWKISVTGNLKYDQHYKEFSEEEKAQFKRELGLKSGKPIVVVGSTHEPEERELLKRLREMLSDVYILLVPRHPERFDAVAEDLKRGGFPFRRYQEKGEAPVILVDSMGILAKCYSIADAAIVAGSFVEKIGGHNILEPAFYSVPIIVGPYMFTQFQEVEELNKVNGCYQVTYDTLVMALKRCIGERNMAAKETLNQLQGSGRRTFAAIQMVNKLFKS